ncbi:DUF6776 family protein [Solilutibacter silvestris]|uniref:DUF6776 family protein n=1 Tax=Solilutibacter silvestris TaxID=1645665 RepID=UPI00101ADD8F|nr:DUF6776 family protein [Lysobacter silvestris]
MTWAIAAVLVLAGAGLGLWRAAHRPLPGALNPGAAMPGNVSDLQQALANARKSDEISRAANAELQKTLAQRDEENASLKADIAFYQRFVGANADHRPLAVQAVRMHQQAAVWRFEAMIAQNTNRDADNSGKFTLGLEGMQDGKLRKLAWSDLRQDAGSDGVPYDFKLFQRVSGDIALPPGFAPTRVLTHLQPVGGAAVDNSFAWKDVFEAD